MNHPTRSLRHQRLAASPGRLAAWLLEIVYPSRCIACLEVLNDDELEDLTRDEDNTMLQHGMKIAQDISEGMLRNGRTRRDCVDGVLR